MNFETNLILMAVGATVGVGLAKAIVERTPSLGPLNSDMAAGTVALGYLGWKGSMDGSLGAFADGLAIGVVASVGARFVPQVL